MKFGCAICICLNSENLICRTTDISKCFRGSLQLRDNESRLYLLPFTSCERLESLGFGAEDYRFHPRLANQRLKSYVLCTFIKLGKDKDSHGRGNGSDFHLRLASNSQITNETGFTPILL